MRAGTRKLWNFLSFDEGPKVKAKIDNKWRGAWVALLVGDVYKGLEHDTLTACQRGTSRVIYLPERCNSKSWAEVRGTRGEILENRVDFHSTGIDRHVPYKSYLTQAYV